MTGTAQPGQLDFSDLSGAPVAVLGLGKSGLATAHALLASGVQVCAWDDSAAGRAAAEAEGIPLVDLNDADWTDLEFLVLSPGIPHSFPQPHPMTVRAKAAGLPIIGDIELLYRAEPEARYIGITGTNGKSTTTALIGHVLAQAGVAVAIGGNLGIPALTFPPLGAKGAYVLEMSSYQLELLDTMVFDSAVLLNITPDHLDRHGGMAGYIAAKERIFARQAGGQAAIIGVGSPPCAEIAERLRRAGHKRIIPISVDGDAAGGISVRDGMLIDDLEGEGRSVIALKTIQRLPGAHNWQNAAAAYAVARLAGISIDTIAAAFGSFPGLVHRQQLVRTIGKVAYIDDSKATNADAAAKALGCYDNIYWIAGGRAKEGGPAGLDPFLPRVAGTFLIGEAAPAFAEWIAGRAPVTMAGTMERAVIAAHEAAQASVRTGGSSVVLLSPACASFDHYPNFEVRGRHFVELVAALPDLGEAAA